MKTLFNEIGEELHKPVVRKFTRRKVIVNDINDIWGIDIVDMSEWKKENNGYVYLLTIIDIFSKFAWCVLLKNKTSSVVLDAFKKVIEKYKVKPKILWADQGSEFYNSAFKKYLKQQDIHLYSTFSESKNAVIERFNRTLKTLMWKYFTSNNTRKYVDVINYLMNFFNNKKHRTINMSPTKAKMQKNRDKVYNYLYHDVQPSKIKKAKFHVGDYVRISRVKGIFEKGYLPNWSREVFTVNEIKNTNPVTYIIKEEDGNIIQGSFYQDFYGPPL